MDALATVAALLDHCETGAPMPESARRHLAHAIRHAASTGERLDTALGLSAAGRRSMQRRVATWQRNRFLAAAVAATAVTETASTWQRCERLAPLATAFAASREYRATRYAPGPREDWPAWQRFVWLALSTDVPLPSSPRQLYDIVQRAGPYSSHSDPVSLLASQL